ncbi:hypothetical protein STENM327S_09328 [Streptomyces tendae]
MSENRQPGPAGRSPTVADVLALPVLAGGEPRVVTGGQHLGRPVRWVHVTELTDPASFLKGGELVLTTGMPLPDDPAGVRRYVDELAAVGAAALVIELVRRYHRPPDALVHACRTHGLPLVTLARDVNFLEVTQVVHTLIVGHQADAIRRTQRVHEAFTALTLRGAGPEEVLRVAAEMSGRTVVLENLVHRALVCEPSGTTVRAALADWERRSRTTPATDRAEVSGPGGWLVAPVEYQGERWGRVVMLPAALPGRALGPEDVTVLERTAMALTISRLTRPTPWERTAHRNALRDLVERRHRSPRTRGPASRRWDCPRSTSGSSPSSRTCRPSRTPGRPRPGSPRNCPGRGRGPSSGCCPLPASACCWRCARPGRGARPSSGWAAPPWTRPRMRR